MLFEDGSADGKEASKAEEIKKIAKYLKPGEAVLMVVTQSRLAPGGSTVTPNTIFITDRKLILRNPMLLGLRENVLSIPYEEIMAVNLEKGLFSCEVIISAPGLTSDLEKFTKASGKRAPAIAAIPKETAVEVVRLIDERIALARGKQPSEPPTPYEELKKLKELLDMGIITEMEYEEKRNDLLSQI
jgi:hypothetical protein